jgi:hypothetical protein
VLKLLFNGGGATYISGADEESEVAIGNRARGKLSDPVVLVSDQSTVK